MPHLENINMHALNFIAIFLLAWRRVPVFAQWAANVPIETRPLDEIYQAAQVENCVLQVAAGGDGTILHQLDIRLLTS